MNKKLLHILFLIVSTTSFAQIMPRIEINGKIVVEANDIEGVTVYNITSDRGTISDFDGNFTIDAKVNDRIEISALQFKKFVVVVDEGIIQQRKMTIFMVEQVNKLPEIVITPYDLSGNMIVDINRVRTTNLPFKKDEFDTELAPIELTPDNKTKAKNPFVRGAGGKADQLGGDIIGIVGYLLKPLFREKKKDQDSEIAAYNTRVGAATKNNDVLDLRLMYSNSYVSRTFGIPEEKVNEFIVFVEDNGLDYELLKDGREMEFVDFLVHQSQSFLELQSAKD
ncbi:MAG: hypothetical protein HKP06_09280 [Flavobacteriaceae bacterium]|nr:hypothetical protein [Flavobacteriaceae bacterium]